jgi:hypothetical protein
MNRALDRAQDARVNSDNELLRDEIKRLRLKARHVSAVIGNTAQCGRSLMGE